MPQLVRTLLPDSRTTWSVVLDNLDDAEYLVEAPESSMAGTRTRIEYRCRQ